MCDKKKLCITQVQLLKYPLRLYCKRLAARSTFMHVLNTYVIILTKNMCVLLHATLALFLSIEALFLSVEMFCACKLRFFKQRRCVMTHHCLTIGEHFLPNCIFFRVFYDQGGPILNTSIKVLLRY